MPSHDTGEELPFTAHRNTAATADPIVNYFDSASAAARYAVNRPICHGRVLPLLRRTLESELPVETALDVGCGTGHSTVALLPYARQIVGVDASSEMLAQAPQHERIQYRKAYAEALPFSADSFDLITVASAYHWFDHELFLKQAVRVLKPGRCLVLYKAGTSGVATHQPDFVRWREDVLNVRYPKVARNHEPLKATEAARFGFDEIARDSILYHRRYTLDAYVDNLLTHSSLIRMVDGGTEPVSAARAWLRDELAPFFAIGEADFTHEARIHVLRRVLKN